MVESPTVNAPAENAHPKRYLRAVSSQGVPASGVRLGSLPENSEEDLRFVQDRIALLGKVTFLISSMFLIVGSSLDLVGSTGRMLALGARKSRRWHIARSRPMARCAESSHFFAANIAGARHGRHARHL